MSLRRTLDRGTGSVLFEEPALSRRRLPKSGRLLLVACGTSWHAALVRRVCNRVFVPPTGRSRSASENALSQPTYRKKRLLVVIALPIRGDRRHAGRNPWRSRAGRSHARPD